MLLFLTRKISGSSDVLMQLFDQRQIPAFRFNVDMFDHYCFEWNCKGFSFKAPQNKKIYSSELTQFVCYKGLLSVDEYADFDMQYTENKWIKSWLNCLYHDLAVFAAERRLLRLWEPWEAKFPKTSQMMYARRYFEVPPFSLHWGKRLASKNVIVKSLTARPFSNRQHMYAKKVNRNSLDPAYPWFTQDIAEGNRDATVLYINGKIHCYQFATERGDLTDWRVTQGTDENRWTPWNAGKEFEQKVDAFMKEIGLHFGRLDFIIGGKEPQFLEVNPCGQFGWLDDEKLTLHNEVVDAIMDPSSTIGI